MRGSLKVQGGSNVNAYAKPKSTSLQAVVTRANGRVENHGTIGYWHRNPIIRAVGVVFYRIDNAIRRAYYGVRA